MRALLSAILLASSACTGAGRRGPEGFRFHYPEKDHLTGREVYRLGYPANAIDKLAGKFVLLDVVVTIEREVPLAVITVPPELVNHDGEAPLVIHAHLISATSIASSRKIGEHLRIEGIIVDEGYGAYTIYVCAFQLLE
ncbi:MAG: hypothetical protein JNK53_00305 [Phycisphaerae bacterium]|nr:hypothetical protein [Phycisphaerae bacterium]